ncbi:YraN family protein [Derxia lacustris]|uniref:YraN family protein n=1 Tax=Derxia lacustris TaxID=764842 RepID=UPI000A16DB8F
MAAGMAPVAEPAPHPAADRRAIGAAYEARARQHLEAAGLVCLDANWRAHFHKQAGEIDLVMRDGATVVFVEVRARASAAFGGALASITPAKQRRWWLAARAWLAAHAAGAEPRCRFDVVAFEAGRLDWRRDVLAA